MCGVRTHKAVLSQQNSSSGMSIVKTSQLLRMIHLLEGLLSLKSLERKIPSFKNSLFNGFLGMKFWSLFGLYCGKKRPKITK